MNTQLIPDSSTKLKSYWSRPGGKFGVIAGLGILGIIGYYVIPIFTTIVWNTLNFGIAVICLALFLYAVTNRKLRLSLFYLYEILMKKLVGVVIELDPFIIAEDDLKDMEEQRELVNKQSIEMESQKEKIDMKMNEKKIEIQKLTTKAQAAKERNQGLELGNAMRQIGRLNEYVAQLTPIQQNLTHVGDFLMKVYKNSAYLIEDARNELELKKDLYNAVTSGSRALNSALKIFKGDPEKKLLIQQSMEYFKDDIAGKLANMKNAIRVSADFMQSIDLDNATYEAEGLKLLDSVNPDSGFKLNNPEYSTVPANNTYSDLLK